jgi:uncharacterized protein YyaL (SSP411 family)
MKHLTPNRLINEKSPYLLQHAYNPVDWYPWGEEAFEKAKKENKPIFLSVGYSTCHWCHVMERESFEDEEVADILNKGFISIKVDREERPDIDSVYMNVCQALTGSGGWPLTVFLTPERTPFFAGTYFPKRSRYGRPGLIELLNMIREKWENERERLEGLGEQIFNSISEQMGESAPGEPGPELLHSCYRTMEKTFDPVYGGFGAAPKFPSPHHLLFLLRYWKRFGEGHALEMVERTLLGMYCGGIFDHIGLGFSRYSTDREWLVPHFEKMLYDNALLAIAYLEAYQATHKEFYASAARAIFTYILRDMTSRDGGFYTAEDADSEGVEGKFYLWTPQELKNILGEEDGDYFCRLYDIKEQGNFEGKSIPNLLKQVLKRGPSLGSGIDDRRENGFSHIPLRNERVDALRQKLFAAREERIHPFKDDKILTSWNGLMIAALARGAWVLGDEKYAQAAEKAVRFILDHLRSKEGRLLARYRDGEAAFPAYLDDYAFLSWGLIELYRATFNPYYLEEAITQAKEMQRLFWDEEDGGFFFTAEDEDELNMRTKEISDMAIPSGNSVAAWNLLQLAGLTGNEELEKLAHRQMHAFGGAVANMPQACTFYLCALDFQLGPPQEIVVAGESSDPTSQEFLDVLRSKYLPQAIILQNQPGRDGQRLKSIAPTAVDKIPLDGKTAVYVCENYACQAPVTNPKELAEEL